MSDCEYNSQINAYYDDFLPLERRAAFEEHLPDCMPCTEELRTFRSLSRMMAVQPKLLLSDGARRRLYFAAKNAAVPGIIRLVKTLTAAAAAILIFASLQLIWTHPAPAPAAMPAAWRQAALVGDLPTDSAADAGADRGDIRLASWIADDLSPEDAMARIKSILIIAFLIVFAAGLMVGMVRGRSTAMSTSVSSTHPDRASFLTAQLNLTPDQAEKIHRIWSEVMKNGPAGGQHMSELDKQRDAAIRAMLSEDQIVKYDQILQNYHAKVETMHAEMHKRIDEAERRTREILTDSQRVKFDEITKERHSHPHEGGRMHGGFMAPPPSPPGTQPVGP